MSRACLFVSLLVLTAMGCCQGQAVPALQWEPLPDLPQPISGHFAGTVGGRLAVIGGSYFPVSLFEGGRKTWVDRIRVLDRPQGRWRTAGRLPHPLAYGATVRDGDGLICLGGGDATRNYAEVFRLAYRGPVLHSVALPALPQECAMMGAARIGSLLYVCGGQRTPADTRALQSLWALDLRSPERGWQVLEPCPGPGRILPVVCAQAGSLYVLSGAELLAGADGKPTRRYLTDAYRYRPGRGWEALPPVPHPVVAAPATAWGQDRILVLGGDDGSLAPRVNELRERHPGFSRDALSLDVQTGKWSQVGGWPAGLVTTTAVRWDDRIVVAGGEDRPGHRSCQVWGLRTGALQP